MSSKQVVIVAGAQGVIGLGAAAHMAALPNTKVYGLSRRAMEDAHNVIPLNVDLLSESDTQRALSHLHEVTHIVFSLRICKQDSANESFQRRFLQPSDLTLKSIMKWTPRARQT